MISVVVADADPESMDRMASMVRWAGGHVFATQTGKEALDRAREREVVLAIVDTHLADMQADEVVRKLHAARSDLHVVVTTARHSEELEARCRREGVLVYAPKPLDEGKVLLILNRFLYPPGAGLARRGSRVEGCR
jgi:two-component system, OmpR family, response regulator